MMPIATRTMALRRLVTDSDVSTVFYSSSCVPYRKIVFSTPGGCRPAGWRSCRLEGFATY